MKRKNINSDLQTRIREYLNFIWRKEKTQNIDEEEKILNNLSHSLKKELKIHAYGFFIKKNPLFTNFFSEESLQKVVGMMKEILLNPGDEIYMVINF